MKTLELYNILSSGEKFAYKHSFLCILTSFSLIIAFHDSFVYSTLLWCNNKQNGEQRNFNFEHYFHIERNKT